MYEKHDGKWYQELSLEISGVNNLPSCINIVKLGNHKYYQIGLWGETHTKFIVGFFNINRRTRVVQFYRVAYENFLVYGDKMNGTVNEEALITTMEFPGEL